MGKRLLIVGNDKTGRRCLHELWQKDVALNGLDIMIDRSLSIKRIWRLMVGKTLPIRCFIKMAAAEVARKKYPKYGSAKEVRSNDDLFDCLSKNLYERVYLFRVGLIISRRNLSLGSEFINVHCASIPEYGGIGSIFLALRDGEMDQKACMHVVTTKIDDGSSILDFEPYVLNASDSYFANEDVAYGAGIRLLIKTLCQNDSSRNQAHSLPLEELP